jgi:phosphoserine phosphatase
MDGPSESLPSNVIALVFDFDDTLVPDSTSKFLDLKGIPSANFWKKDVKALVRSGCDPTLAFLKLFLDNVGADKRLGLLTNKDLRKFGKTLDEHIYPGLIPGLFDDLKRTVKKFRDVSIEFYIVSGGLQPIIEGTKLVRGHHFSAVYGCQLGEEPVTHVVKFVKRAITFTEKTRYLFEISKGILPAKARRNPYLVNDELPGTRIPFSNMIYVGDGLTDIPCFSLVGKRDGFPFGVFDSTKARSAKRAFLKFLIPGRVKGMHTPRYGPEDDLGRHLRTAVATICSQIKLARVKTQRAI